MTKHKDMIDRVDGEIQSLNRIVTEFLDFARPTPLEWDMINLSEIIGTVLALLNREFDDSGIQVNISDLDLLPSIRADAEQLKSVFTNIIKNAMQAMTRGGILTISGTTVPEDSMISIEFVDTGVGIPQDAIERIFDPFFTTRDTGTGMGLAIVKRLLEAHSGTIECQSEEGRGTKFTITLPMKNEDAERKEP